MTNIKSQGSHCSSVLSQQKQTCNSELVHWFLFGDCKNYLCCPFLKQGMLSKFRFSETFTKFGKISDLVLTFSQTMLHSQNIYRTRAIISRGLYFFLLIFHYGCGLFCRAAIISWFFFSKWNSIYYNQSICSPCNMS